MRTKTKIFIDILMIGFLLFLMAYQIMEEALHEWLGARMLLLLILHNILNIHWYQNLFNGKYGILRSLWTAVNFAVLAVMLVMACSGIIMSRHVFAFLPISKGMALARVMHLAGRYWGLVLMSIHLGFHWGMVTSQFSCLTKGKKLVVALWGVRLIVAAVAVYGAVSFWQADAVSYMFLKKEFAFFDFEKKAFFVIAEYIAMMAFWVFLSYYMTKEIRRIFVKKGNS